MLPVAWKERSEEMPVCCKDLDEKKRRIHFGGLCRGGGGEICRRLRGKGLKGKWNGNSPGNRRGGKKGGEREKGSTHPLSTGKATKKFKNRGTETFWERRGRGISAVTEAGKKKRKGGKRITIPPPDH